jgi:hypothetical protein
MRRDVAAVPEYTSEYRMLLGIVSSINFKSDNNFQ